MSEGLDRYSEGSGETEVSEFNKSFFCDQYVLRLEVPVHDSVRMTVINSFDDLIDKALNEFVRQFLLHLSKILLEVVFDVFEHQIQAIVRVDDFFESGGERVRIMLDLNSSG